MKVCFLSSMHPPFDKRVFEKEALSLVSAGFSVTHLCPGDASHDGVHGGVKVKTFRARNGIRGRLAQLRQLYRDAASVKADVYHCNEVDSWFVGLTLKLFRGKKCICDVHEHYPSTFADGRLPDWTRPLVSSGISGLLRVLSHFTDAIVLAKKSVGPDFRGNKILTRNFAQASAIGETTSEKSDGPLEIVHLGLLSRVRGWPQMLDALAMMDDRTAKLIVAGEINDGSRGDFDGRVAELGLSNRVTVHDWMPFKDAFELCCRAHVGLIVFQPGIQNHVCAMPHKMFDYMAAGMAVICPEFAEEVAYIVPEERCGYLVDPSSPKDLAEKLDRLAANRQETLEMGRRGRRAVIDRYNWEAEAETLLDCYRAMKPVVKVTGRDLVADPKI